MQTKFGIEVRVFPEFPGDRDDGYQRIARTYTSRESAERAAYRIECRNGANGVGCDARVVEVK